MSRVKDDLWTDFIFRRRTSHLIGEKKFLTIRAALRSVPALATRQNDQRSTLLAGLRILIGSVVVASDGFASSTTTSLNTSLIWRGKTKFINIDNRDQYLLARHECAIMAIRSCGMYVRNSGSNFESWHAAINWSSSSLSPDPETMWATPTSVFFENVEADANLYEGSEFDAASYGVCSALNFNNPLWSAMEEKAFSPLFREILNPIFSESAFSFWREWYQGFLDGKPMDRELQRRVALIADPIWEAGPEAVAEEIERIRAEWLAEKVPQAETIEFNPETGKFFAVPLDIAKPDLLGASLSQVEDALDDVLASASNGLHDNAREVRVLQRVFRKYGNDPQQIEMGFVSVHKGLTRQILNDELPASEENLALQSALEEGARGIRATHPEVAENRKILTDQAIREMPEDAVELLEDVKPLLVAYSEGDLADDWAQDIPQLINDALRPLPSGAPPLPGMDEATRIFSRSAKMKMRYDVITKKGAEIFDSNGMKTTRLGLTLGGALSALVGLGLRLFGLI